MVFQLQLYNNHCCCFLLSTMTMRFRRQLVNSFIRQKTVISVSCPIPCQEHYGCCFLMHLLHCHMGYKDTAAVASSWYACILYCTYPCVIFFRFFIYIFIVIALILLSKLILFTRCAPYYSFFITLHYFSVLVMPKYLLQFLLF